MTSPRDASATKNPMKRTPSCRLRWNPSTAGGMNSGLNSSGSSASAGSWITSEPPWAIWMPSFMYVPGSLPPMTYSDDGKYSHAPSTTRANGRSIVHDGRAAAGR